MVKMDKLSLDVIFLIGDQLCSKDLRSLSITCKAFSLPGDYFIMRIIKEYTLCKSLLVIVKDYPWLATPTVFENLLKKGARINQRDKPFSVPLLHYVVNRGLVSLLPMFKDYIKDENLNTHDTALHVAVWNGDVTMVQGLLELGACFSSLNNKFQSPVHLAVTNRRLDILKILLNGQSSLRDIRMDTVLALAIPKTHRMELKFLIEKLDLEPHWREYVLGKTILIAMRARNIKTTCFLIDNINHKTLYVDDHRNTPFHIAAQLGQISLLEYFVESELHGINLRNSAGNTPLHIAAIHGQMKVVEYLINNHSNPNIKNIHGFTPLCHAIQHRHPKIAFKLASVKCIDITRDYITKETPLHLAVLYGQLKVVKVILPLVKDICVDWKEQNPLHIAAMGTSLETVKLLIEKFPESIDKKNRDGFTPLHFAARGGHLKIVEYLLSKNADTIVTNNDNQTPQQLARIYHHLRIANILGRTNPKTQTKLHDYWK